MIPGFLKAPLSVLATAAATSNLALVIDPEVFRNTALAWIAVGSTVVFALVAAVSQIVPKVAALIEKIDAIRAERRARLADRIRP